jgi:GAF domain-containing protein
VVAIHAVNQGQAIGDQYDTLTRTVCGTQGVKAARNVAAIQAAKLLGTPWTGFTRYGPPRGLSFVAASDDLVRRVGRIAVTLKEGLGWQAYVDSARVVFCRDLMHEDRWPNYCRLIVGDLPVRSGMAATLLVGDEAIGALVAYADRPGYFDERRLVEATRLADRTALCLAHVESREKARNLQLALRSSQEIGIAVGIIMERLKATEERAFDLLRTASQARHVKIRELAARVVMTGEMPHPNPCPHAVAVGRST